MLEFTFYIQFLAPQTQRFASDTNFKLSDHLPDFASQLGKKLQEQPKPSPTSLVAPVQKDTVPIVTYSYCSKNVTLLLNATSAEATYNTRTVITLVFTLNGLLLHEIHLSTSIVHRVLHMHHLHRSLQSHLSLVHDHCGDSTEEGYEIQRFKLNVNAN